MGVKAQAKGQGFSVDEQIARLNIEHFQKKLASETDEAKRQTLLNSLLTKSPLTDSM